jgi:hypothetical protein
MSPMSAALVAAHAARKLNPPAPRPSSRKAINAKCKDCIYDPVDGGTWRQQVEACTSPDCALFQLRPVSMPKDTKEPSTRCERTTEATISGNGEALAVDS